MKTYGAQEAQIHTFLTSTLDTGKQSASYPHHFTTKVKGLQYQGKGTGKFTLQQAMKAQSEGKTCSSTLSLTSVLVGGAHSMPRPGCLTTGNRPSTHCTRGWMGHTVSLDGCRKSHSHQNLIPRPSNPYQATIFDHTIMAHPPVLSEQDEGGHQN